VVINTSLRHRKHWHYQNHQPYKENDNYWTWTERLQKQQKVFNSRKRYKLFEKKYIYYLLLGPSHGPLEGFSYFRVHHRWHPSFSLALRGRRFDGFYRYNCFPSKKCLLTLQTGITKDVKNNALVRTKLSDLILVSFSNLKETFITQTAR